MGELVDDFGQNNTAQEALGWFLHPIRTVKTMLGALQQGKERVLEEKVDKTVIGEGGSIDTVVGELAHFADCGHYLKGNLGGKCSCQAIVCKECLRRCALCGSPLCPACSVPDPASGQVLCRICYDELSYQRRAQAIARGVASLFLDSGGRKDETK